MCQIQNPQDPNRKEHLPSNHLKKNADTKKYPLCSKKDELYIMNIKRLHLRSVLFFWINRFYNI